MRTHHFFAVGLVLIACSACVQPVFGQQSDTSRVTKELEEQEPFFQSYHSERSVGNLYMPKTGTFNVPEPKQYYTPPFMGQKYLEIALAHYYKKLKEEEGGPLYRILKIIAPYINNGFEFFVYQIYDMPIVDRDQPMLEPQLNGRDSKQKSPKEQ